MSTMKKRMLCFFFKLNLKNYLINFTNTFYTFILTYKYVLTDFLKVFFVIEMFESGYIKHCCLPLKHVINGELYSNPSQTSNMELFLNLVNCFQLLSIFAKKTLS